MEAQQEAVRSYLNGSAHRLVAEVVEVESGKNSGRPKLAEALRLAKLHRGTLMTAKLDRLARNVAFVSSLMESGIEFTAVDFPQANRLTIHILAAVAEHEAGMISARTKAALAATKARGTKLGGYRGFAFNSEHQAAGVVARRSAATARIAEVAPVIAELQQSGVGSLRGLCEGADGARHSYSAGGPEVDGRAGCESAC